VQNCTKALTFHEVDLLPNYQNHWLSSQPLIFSISHQKRQMGPRKFHADGLNVHTEKGGEAMQRIFANE
jgi:hypothetical protein